MDMKTKVIELLRGAGKLLVVSHARPDGDTLGCVVALTLAARAAGRQAQVLVPDRVPAQYQFLFEGEPPPPAADRFAPLADWADLIVILDACTRSQLGNVAGGVVEHRRKVAAIDHHATAEDLADARWIDTTAAATGVLVTEALTALAWPVGPRAAEALVTAIVTDTGWLRFASTDARCLAAVGKWLAAGVRPDRLYRTLFQNDRPQRLRLVARMLQTLEFTCGGRLASMMIRSADFDTTGALREETENLVNEPLRIGTVEGVVLAVENPDTIRVSLRSRETLDVAKVAERFGGGGHARAAGIRIVGNLEDIRRRVVAACSEAMGR